MKGASNKKLRPSRSISTRDRHHRRDARTKSEIKSLQKQFQSNNFNLQDVFFMNEEENTTVPNIHVDSVPTADKDEETPSSSKGKEPTTSTDNENATIKWGRSIPHFPILPKSLTFSQVVFLIEQTIINYVNLPHEIDQFFLTGKNSSEGSSVLEGKSTIGFRDDVNVKTDIYKLIIKPMVLSLSNPSVSDFDYGNTPLVYDNYGLADQHEGILTALFVLQFQFSIIANSNEAEEDEERAIAQARSYAVEAIATKYLIYLTQLESINNLTYDCQFDFEEEKYIAKQLELQGFIENNDENNEVNDENNNEDENEVIAKYESSIPVLLDYESQLDTLETIESLNNLCALEIAVLNDCKRFLIAPPVRRITLALWSGKVIMWDKITPDAIRSPTPIFDSSSINCFAKLRIPQYRTFLIALNYFILLVLYMVTLNSYKAHVHKDMDIVEIFMHIWFFGIILEEFSQLNESANLNYYLDDFSNLMDLCIIFVYLGSLITRIIGFMEFDNDNGNGLWYAGISFDLLALEAVLLIPRAFSFLAVFPYFGGLLPGLTDMCVQFFKFMFFVIVVYLGFLVAFAMLGYKNGYSWGEMSSLLIHVFFGSSNEGFKYDQGISPWLGPPLMLIFVTMSKLLLVSVLVSLMNNKFRVSLANANQTYVLTFSSIVVEMAVNNTELTYFFPPFNILNQFLRLFRFFLNEKEHRALRIWVLKLTHWPLVLIVLFLEATIYRPNNKLKLKRQRRIRRSNKEDESFSLFNVVNSTQNKLEKLKNWQHKRSTQDDFSYRHLIPVGLSGPDKLKSDSVV